jgi:hypothetical protein
MVVKDVLYHNAECSTVRASVSYRDDYSSARLTWAPNWPPNLSVSVFSSLWATVCIYITTWLSSSSPVSCILLELQQLNSIHTCNPKPCSIHKMAQPHPLYAMTMPGHQIRLLEILPSKNHDKQYILCKLQQFDVEHAPSYEALSYCWGDATIRANIMLDAQETSVTKSLHDALSILQKPDQPRMLWVDALCVRCPPLPQ